jgi:hypothetical protein
MKVTIELIEGVSGQCVSINDRRVAGPKPWGGGRVVRTWHADVSDILKAVEEQEKQTEKAGCASTDGAER